MDVLYFTRSDFDDTVRKSLDFTASVRKSVSESRFVSNLNFLGTHLRTVDVQDSPGIHVHRRKSRNIRRPSYFKRLEPYVEPKPAEKLTLREMAQIYRERYPEKYKRRLVEREEQRRLSLGIIEPDPMIVAYVEAQMKVVEEKKQQEAKRKLMPRTITIELKYNTAEQVKAANEKGNSDVAAPELSLTVIKGKNLFNHMKETEERCEKCCVKALLFPDGERGDKYKSSHRFLTMTGTTGWEHKFTFPWCTPETMRNKYIIITVSGLIRAGDKKFIGMAALVGKEALVHIEGTKHREPKLEETTMLEQALENPDEAVFAQLKLYQRGWEGMQDITYVEKEPVATGRRGSVFALLATNEEDIGKMPAFIAKGNRPEGKRPVKKTDSQSSLGLPTNNGMRYAGIDQEICEDPQRRKVSDRSGLVTASQYEAMLQDGDASSQRQGDELGSEEGLHRQLAMRKKRDSSVSACVEKFGGQEWKDTDEAGCGKMDDVTEPGMEPGKVAKKEKEKKPADNAAKKKSKEIEAKAKGAKKENAKDETSKDSKENKKVGKNVKPTDNKDKNKKMIDMVGTTAIDDEKIVEVNSEICEENNNPIKKSKEIMKQDKIAKSKEKSSKKKEKESKKKESKEKEKAVKESNKTNKEAKRKDSKEKDKKKEKTKEKSKSS